MNRVLLIAFHFPPMSGSSGVHRTLKFSQHLREFGWESAVLTAHPRVHPNVSNDQLAEIPGDVVVRRSFALDTAKHLSIGGRYPRFLASPDRWMSWWISAVPAGRAMIRRFKPDVLWSTYPISTAHWIGSTLARMSGLPWVADFRDPMTEPDFPHDPVLRRKLRKLESRIVRQADKVIFTAPGTCKMYSARYGDIVDDRWTIIENGYDENAFASIKNTGEVRREDAPVVLVHSGILYPSERDPTQFFAALRSLRDRGAVDSATLRIVLRATGHDDVIMTMLRDFGLTDIVSIEPAISHQEAIAEMLESDGLLLFQAANCNFQIPAKLYEYFRAGRPIFALTDPVGDTAGALRRGGYNDIASIDHIQDIEGKFIGFIDGIRHGGSYVAGDQIVATYSRRHQTSKLASVLESVLVV
jgi:hypothetical protein